MGLVLMKQRVTIFKDLFYLENKQAENGLQSRSSKMAVIDDHGLDYHRLSTMIMDYNGLS